MKKNLFWKKIDLRGFYLEVANYSTFSFDNLCTFSISVSYSRNAHVVLLRFPPLKLKPPPTHVSRKKKKKKKKKQDLTKRA